MGYWRPLCDLCVWPGGCSYSNICYNMHPISRITANKIYLKKLADWIWTPVSHREARWLSSYPCNSMVFKGSFIDESFSLFHIKVDPGNKEETIFLYRRKTKYTSIYSGAIKSRLKLCSLKTPCMCVCVCACCILLVWEVRTFWLRSWVLHYTCEGVFLHKWLVSLS